MAILSAAGDALCAAASAASGMCATVNSWVARKSRRPVEHRQGEQRRLGVLRLGVLLCDDAQAMVATSHPPQSYGLRHTDVTVTKPDGSLAIASTLLGKLTSVDAIGNVAFTSSRAELSVASGPVPGVSSKTTDGPFTSRRYTSWRVVAGRREHVVRIGEPRRAQ
jgi:hypothetical protein